MSARLKTVRLPAGVDKALERFREALPGLLAESPGQWVAVDAERVRHTGPDRDRLYDKCMKAGLREDEFIVRCVLPDAFNDHPPPAHS